MTSKKTLRILPLLLLVILAGCMPTYTLVNPGPVAVANRNLTVTPSTAWNRVPKQPSGVAWEEIWTRNGPLLDTIAFVGGLPDGEALVKQKKKSDRQVPAFRATMSPDDLVSMIEARYRVAGVSLFTLASVEPARFLGSNAIRIDFSFVAPDQLPRRGRCVMGVIGDKLYLMKLEGATSHYFDAALPEFDAMLTSVTMR